MTFKRQIPGYVIFLACIATLSPSVFAMCTSPAVDVAVQAAIYGYAGCFGVDTTDAEELANSGCIYQLNDDGTVNRTNAVSMAGIFSLCRRTDVKKADGMPVTFSRAIDASTLDSGDFLVTLSDGSRIVPQCATLSPADEANEGRTVLLIGAFGDGLNGTINPTKVEVVGDLCFYDDEGAPSISSVGAGLEILNDPMMSYLDASIIIIDAEIRMFSTNGEATLSSKGNVCYPNHCGAIFSEVSHVIRVTTNGGFTTNGLEGYANSDRSIFEVYFANGTHLDDPDAYIGIADLGALLDDVENEDHDNVYDLCLRLPVDEAEQVSRVTMPCTGKGAGVPPKGFPACFANSFDLVG